jgi:lipopolysaccharide transport system permease protein
MVYLQSMDETNAVEDWDLIIKPKSSVFNIGLKQLWSYRDLLLLFVKRDFVSVYKQTILGPIWIFIQPVLTSVTFTIIFTNVANLSTNDTPAFLFYLAGITLWTYFADCLTKTSNTFITNAGIFGKVYFPRLIIPLSVLLSNGLKLGAQLLLFIAVWLYYMFTTDKVHPNAHLLLVPVLIIIMAGLGLGFGIIVSSLTTKYRDLTFLVAFGVQLMMYASSIVFPISGVKGKFKQLLLLNPVTSVIEAFKYGFVGEGFFSWGYLLYSLIFMIVILILGIFIFNKIEKSFIDTV